MAIISPFKGLRFSLKKPEDLGTLIAPPYDMLNAQLVDALYEKHPCNVVRIDQNRAEASDPGNRTRHERAARLFAEWRKNGSIIADDQPSLYVYEQRFAVERAGRIEQCERSGVVSLVKLVDFSEGVVLPHEYTLSGPKADRYEHLDATRLNVGQIFGLLSDEAGTIFPLIRSMKSGNALGTATDADGVVHTIYKCSDRSLIDRFCQAVRPSTILIADGHHRYETALKFHRDHGNEERFSSVMMTLVSMADPGLVVRPFHRCIKKGPGGQSVDMRQKLAGFFSLADLGPATLAVVNDFLAGRTEAEMVFADSLTGHAFGLTLSAAGEAFLQSSISDRSTLWKHLDMSKINTIVIKGILGLPLDGHVLHDTIAYMNDASAALATAPKREEYYGCFFIRPVSLPTIHRIVRGNERMPQKSTNFYPKLYSGLVFNGMGEP